MATKWISENKESELQSVIQNLTTTGRKTLDEVEMKKLKSICKLSDTYVNCAFYSLMTQLRKDHAEIRYSSLLVINELVTRSSVFRAKLEADFEEFLELVEETDPENPLPLPVPVAKQLKIKGIEFIKNWAAKFGEKYIRFQLALNYLQKCRKVDFDDIEARNSAQRQRQQREQERLDRVLKEKITKVKSEMLDTIEELCGITTQMENCLKLLLPHAADNLFTAADFDIPKSPGSDANNDDGKNCLENKLRHHGFHDMKKSITIEVDKNSEIAVSSNKDTSPIIDNLKDLEKQISNRYYPMVARWLKVLTKGSNCSDNLKQAIDLKLLMERNLERYKELNIKPSKPLIDSDEDEDFEEVKDKEGYEETVKRLPVVAGAPKPGSSKDLTVVEQACRWKMKHHKDDIKDPTTALSNINKRFKSSQPATTEVIPISTSHSKNEQKNGKKSELLEKAPVLPYDIDLYHWEEEKPLIPEVVRFDSLHKFWETKDECEENETYKEVQMASLRTRKIDFSGKFEPVKWSCRAPLKNGKLCPRKDRFKCPFHGKVIPRDALGNPSGDPSSVPGTSKDSPDKVPDWQDPQLLSDIEAATGIDLKIPKKGERKGGKNKKEGLTNIKKINNTARQRLTKKIMKRYRHYAPKLDEVEKKRFNDKFGDQWNYY